MNGDIEAPDVTTEATPLINESTRSIRLLPGMKVRAQLIKSDATLETSLPKEALAKGRIGKANYWIDVDADERDSHELANWLKQLKLSPFLTSRLAEPPDSWASQVIAFPKTTLAIVRILPQQEASDDIAHLAALLVGGLILTFTSCKRSETGNFYVNTLAFMKAREKLPDASISGVLLAWLLFHINRTSTSVRELRFHVLRMDESMDRNIESVEFMELINVKDQLLRLLSVAEEQMECLESLVGAEAMSEPLDFSKLQGTLTVLRATASATERMALRLEKQIGDLRQRHESHQQDRMNRRLAILTILSAVFLPLTLITGIWGMNFAYMPELQNHFAYPIALLCMLGVAVSMVCFFWRTGWLE